MDTSRLSATTDPVIDRSLDEALRLITEAGFRRVDLVEKMPHLSLDPSVCRLDDVQATAQTHGVDIAHLATHVGAELQSSNPEKQEQAYISVIRAIDAAVALGARSIRGFRSQRYDDPQNLTRLVPWLQKCAAYAAEKKIYLLLENHGGELSGSPVACTMLADEVNSPWFGILYDPCNLMTAGADYRDGLDVMKDHIKHVQLKDGREVARSQQTTELGDGSIKFKWLLSALDDIGYTGEITMSYELTSGRVDDDLKRWFEFMEKL